MDTLTDCQLRRGVTLCTAPVISNRKILLKVTDSLSKLEKTDAGCAPLPV